MKKEKDGQNPFNQDSDEEIIERLINIKDYTQETQGLIKAEAESRPGIQEKYLKVKEQLRSIENQILEHSKKEERNRKDRFPAFTVGCFLGAIAWIIFLIAEGGKKPIELIFISVFWLLSAPLFLIMLDSSFNPSKSPLRYFIGIGGLAIISLLFVGKLAPHEIVVLFIYYFFIGWLASKLLKNVVKRDSAYGRLLSKLWPDLRIKSNK